jgi:hypothetical protein
MKPIVYCPVMLLALRVGELSGFTLFWTIFDNTLTSLTRELV